MNAFRHPVQSFVRARVAVREDGSICRLHCLDPMRKSAHDSSEKKGMCSIRSVHRILQDSATVMPYRSRYIGKCIPAMVPGTYFTSTRRVRPGNRSALMVFVLNLLHPDIFARDVLSSISSPNGTLRDIDAFLFELPVDLQGAFPSSSFGWLSRVP